MFASNVFSADKVTLSGCLYNDSIEKFGLADVGVNPFYAFWFIRCYDFEGNTYHAQLDEKGCFSIDISVLGKPVFVLFFNQKDSFQAGMCFPDCAKGTPVAYYSFVPSGSGTIDLGKLRVDAFSAVPSSSVQKSLDIDKRYYARDIDNDGIPDGFDVERHSHYYAGIINFYNDLDNDGISDSFDIDIDDDGVPNELDDDVDDDGVPNERDEDNTNDGINDNAVPSQPKIELAELDNDLSNIVVLPITLSDDNGDYVSLTVNYSIDGGVVYHPATLIDTNGCHMSAHPVGIEYNLKWDAESDLGPVNLDGVILSLTPFDSQLTGDTIVVRDIKIRNNHAPEILFSSPVAGKKYKDRITIKWQTNDIDEGQELKVEGIWFSFDRENFLPLSDNLPASGSYDWDIGFLGYKKGCWLFITVADGYEKSWAQAGPFTIEEDPFLPALRIESPLEPDGQVGESLNIVWNSGADDNVRYGVYVSQDGYSWNEIAKRIHGSSLDWDIRSYPNSAGYRVMVQAYQNNRVAYAFSPQFTIKNVNTPPELTLIEPVEGSVLSGQTQIRWSINDADPGDKIESVVLEYILAGKNVKYDIARLNSGVNSFLWDVSKFPENQIITLRISVSDGQSVSSVNVRELRIDNPPVLLKIDQPDSETIELLFSENVKNVYQSISFSGGIKLKGLRRLASERYIITTTPLQPESIYTMILGNEIIDDSGHNMAEVSISLGGIEDKIQPELAQPLTPIDSTHLDVVFSEPVLNADKIEAYTINPSIKVYYVLKLTDSSYRMVTEQQDSSVFYNVLFHGITDLSGNPLKTENKQAIFKGTSLKTVRVDKSGNGDFIDLETALRNVPKGAFIHLAAGIYADGLNIPSSAHVTIQGGFNPLTWEQEPGLESIIEAKGEQTALICSGIARLIDLKVTGAQTGVKIYKGHCIMYRCSIFDNQETGLYIMRNASAQIVNCSIYGNKDVGINIFTDKTVMVLNSVIYNNESHGVYISALGNVTIANSIIRKNMYGVFLKKCGHRIPVIEHNCFYRNNRAKSLDGSYSVLDSCSAGVYVVNSQERLEQIDKGWIGNVVADPKWDIFFHINENSNLLKAGSDTYSGIFNSLPESIVRDKEFCFPIGLIKKR